MNLKIQRAKDCLQGKESGIENTLVHVIPHFIIDLSSDGVKIFENSEQAECNPLMVTVYGICKTPDTESTLFKQKYPVIIGVAHDHKKPTAKSLMARLFQELVRLSPDNTNPGATAGRQFTVGLRCVVATGRSGRI